MARNIQTTEEPPSATLAVAIAAPQEFGCAVCGAERFAHKPDSYYGRIGHACRP